MPDPEDYLWNPSAKADPDIAPLERALSTFRDISVDPLPATLGAEVSTAPSRWRRWERVRWPLAAAAVLALFASLNLYHRVVRPWGVVLQRDSGGTSAFPRQVGRVEAGQWIVTDATTRARLNVGSIGRAELGPSSRLRVMKTGGGEHRLALITGSMHARIWAPPRFFVVETTSAMAVDLGCVYTLHADSAGGAWLHVQSGAVELVGSRHRAWVAAGNAAGVHPEHGPGLPYPFAATDSFVQIVRAFDSAPGNSALAQALLALASSETTITVWHLLWRVPAASRGVVYDRLAAIAPPPSGVTRSGVEQLDERMLDAWRSALEEAWSKERVPPWKKYWRRLWASRE